MNCLCNRMKKKNYKIQLLALELLDFSMEHGSDFFLMQIAGKEFMNIFIKLIELPDINTAFKIRGLSLIQKWARKYEHKKEILPLFQKIYSYLKSKNFTFPDSTNEAYGTSASTFQSPNPYTKSNIQESAENNYQVYSY